MRAPKQSRIAQRNVRIVVDERVCLFSHGVIDLDTILAAAAAPLDSFVLRVDGGISKSFHLDCRTPTEDLVGARFRVFPGGAPFTFFVDGESWIWGMDTVTVGEVLSIAESGSPNLTIEGEYQPLDADRSIDLAVAIPPRFRIGNCMGSKAIGCRGNP